MERTRAYQENYDRIARDHIWEWSRTGANPFQDKQTVMDNEDATVAIAERYLKPGVKVLDAGCGMGSLMARLSAYEVYGIDIAADYVQIAQERGVNAQVGKIEKLPWPSRTFDMVLATDVLEHVLDLNRAVRELLRVLKRGGVLVARTPHDEDLDGFEDSTYEFCHLRRFDEPTFRLLFTRVFGCEVLEVTVVGDEIHAVARKC